LEGLPGFDLVACLYVDGVVEGVPGYSLYVKSDSALHLYDQIII